MHFLLMFSEVWNIKANKQKEDAIVSPTIAPLLLIRAYNIPYYLFDCYSCILFYTTILLS